MIEASAGRLLAQIKVYARRIAHRDPQRPSLARCLADKGSMDGWLQSYGVRLEAPRFQG